MDLAVGGSQDRPTAHEGERGLSNPEKDDECLAKK